MTHPGQKRYIKFLEDCLTAGPQNLPFKPAVKRLLGLKFHGIPNFNNGTCRPFIDIYNVRLDEKVSFLFKFLDRT